MDELESARSAKEITQAWQKVSDLMDKIPSEISAHSPLFAALREAIINYRVLETNRYKEMTSEE